MDFPSGHCSANGLKFWGRVGGLFGFGINCNHPDLHWRGIQGGFISHHLANAAWRVGAMISASEFQTIPGAHGAAVAFCDGINFNACVKVSTSKGTPGAVSHVIGVKAGPLQVSLTYATSKLRSSHEVTSVPSSPRN